MVLKCVHELLHSQFTFLRTQSTLLKLQSFNAICSYIYSVLILKMIALEFEIEKLKELVDFELENYLLMTKDGLAAWSKGVGTERGPDVFVVCGIWVALSEFLCPFIYASLLQSLPHPTPCPTPVTCLLFL